ncbi:MAG: ATP-NAD kinase family protein [Thermovirgaceae bacterium]|nr:ATP-NAD kinase family protein [Thermovirgaceae bacterium]
MSCERSDGIKRLGLIVNPVAGMGGSVGLKGTDGKDILQEAIALGASPRAPLRAAEALEELSLRKDGIEIFVFSGDMGASESASAGFRTVLLGAGSEGRLTSADDTVMAARLMEEAGVELILFAGGDGTARDMVMAVGTRVPVVGIPAGVKIHSPVFARNPAGAGKLADLFLFGSPMGLEELEVMDIDEEAFRGGIVRTSLYGYLRVPFERRHLQGGKSGGGKSEAVELDGVVREAASRMTPGVLYLVGPGSTTAALMRRLGCEHTLLGVDAIRDGRTTGKDLSEKEILKIVEPGNTRLIVTVIGGQGFILGRGNQQISPEVVRLAGKENIMIISTPSKLRSLIGKSLFVDTGDTLLDMELCGYIRVITGLGEETIFRVER